MNRALAHPGVVRGRRGALRAPAVWPARVMMTNVPGNLLRRTLVM